MEPLVILMRGKSLVQECFMGPRPLLCYQLEEQGNGNPFLSADVNKHRTEPASDFSICCQPDVRAEESSHHSVENCCWAKPEVQSAFQTPLTHLTDKVWQQ
ncbi:uncharacterized protein ACIB01_013262 [Guaruba guarouba]